MKLIENIVKTVPREKIPLDAKWFVQDKDGFMKNSSSEMKPKFIGGTWSRGFGHGGSMVRLFITSEDAATTIITREELMRAYDLVEQGYTLWFGGDCPVGRDVVVDYVMDRNFPYDKESLPESVRANDLDWGGDIFDCNIIAYKVADIKHDEQPAIIETYNPSSTILCDLMRDISNSMPEMMAADMIELADYLIAQGWCKHE